MITETHEKQLAVLLDGLGDAGIAALVELARDIPVADLKLGLLVAKDELMRVAVMRELTDDFNSGDADAMDASRAILRKMYSQHAADPATDSYPLSLVEVAALPKADIVSLFDAVADPLPGTLVSRPEGT